MVGSGRQISQGILVRFASDTEMNLRAAVDLVNSLGISDKLQTLSGLDDFYHAHGYSGRRDRTHVELDDVRALRWRLRTIFGASRDEMAGLVNELLSAHSARPRLVRHDELDWHIDAVAEDAPLAARIGVETAVAVLDLIRLDEQSRLSGCADPSCAAVLFDLTRNRSRRYCGPACSNRAATAAYRGRRRLA